MTETGKRGWGLSSLVLVGVSLLGCSASAPAEEEAVSVDGILVCGETPEATRAEGAAPYEWYSARAMNNKLRNFPDFAKFSGLRSVSSCDDARHFYDRYVEYGAANPRFDKDEPLPADWLTEAPLPDHLDEIDAAELAEEAEVQKLKNGTGDRLSPVVGLSYTPLGASPTYCTGSFIAKNWIMTAAHCMQTAPGWVLSQGEAAAKVHAWYEWKVSVAGPQGVVGGDVRTFKYVLQYVDPRYVGFRGSFAEPHDFALLYVLDSQDGRLPNNIPNASGSNVPYLRLSLRSSVTASSSTIWGMGEPDPSTLMRGPVSPYSLAAVTGQPLLTATVPSGTGVPYVCGGDSGGPIVDRYDILNPATGVPEPQYVAAAILSSGGPASRDCADQPGDIVNWVRTDEERNFIGLSVADRYPFFACKEKQSANSTSNDYYECWGPPCQADADCSADQACFRPGSQLTGCTGCPSGGCDCIYGQCFKAEP